MRINPIINYVQNQARFSMPKISFGEIDGDFYSCSSRRISRESYETKKDKINEKYDKMRSSWLSDCDDLEISHSAVLDKLNQIEKHREMDLAELSREYDV